MKALSIKQRNVILTILIALTMFFISMFIARKVVKNIYRGIEFSKAYTDRNGELLQIFMTSEDKFRIYIPLEEFPESFVQAVLLQEDRYFYNHNGVNLGAVFRAFWETYIKRSRRMGASTITMQTAKLKYNLYTKNPIGKIKQILLSYRLEFFYTKDQILECYLNLVPCGSNIEGFETAAWYYFNKSVRDLTLSEAFTLVVLPQNPVKRAPKKNNNPQELLNARKILYDSWCESHPEAKSDSIYFNMKTYTFCRFPDKARHYAEMLNSSDFDKVREIRGKTKTTLDSNLQDKCQYTLENYIRRNSYLGVKNGAVLLIDKEKMEVLCGIGSVDFYNEKIDGQVNALNSKRSPGSTLKPFIYSMALDQGLIHYSTMLRDSPQTFSEYVPDNYESVFKGPLAAWFALCDSRNIPAVDLARRIENPDLYQFMQDCNVRGMKDRGHYGLSIVLGSCEVTMFELGNMYATLGNEGVYKNLNFVLNRENHERGKRLLSKESSFIVRQMLEQNIPPIDLNNYLKQVPVAWKTGTSIGFKDSWTAGIFDRYILVAWIGNFDGQGNNSFLGRKMTGPLFFELASVIMGDLSDHELIKTKVPEKVTRVQVCKVSGELPNEFCPKTEETWFIPGVSPITKCNIHRQINIDTRTGYRTNETEGEYVRTVVREFWPSDLQELFKLAGLPRLEPPSFPPDQFSFDTVQSGFPPKIMFPLDRTSYVFRMNTPERNVINLSAGCDADTNELLWFCGTEFIGRCYPGYTLEWRPDPGVYDVTVCDSRGRSSSVSIEVMYQ